MLDSIRRTDPARHVVFFRLVAGLPLLAIGFQHLSGAAPLAPILADAHIPASALAAVLAPLGQVLAGVLLLTGAFGRIGAFLAAVQMIVALYTQVLVDWTSEPPFALPIAVFLASLYVIWGGSGAYSVDRARTLRHQSAALVRA
ncbi:MAG: DoxX family protein [Planctomycetota bacterium]|jgi:uncharacterized membrane protein YphA (DoxX/SURF4 family)